jgi:hypothetical protein
MSSGGALRLAISTWAPSSTKRRAIAKPMPRLAPVTIAVFPVSMGIWFVPQKKEERVSTNLLAVHRCLESQSTPW